MTIARGEKMIVRLTDVSKKHLGIMFENGVITCEYSCLFQRNVHKYTL